MQNVHAWVENLSLIEPIARGVIIENVIDGLARDRQRYIDLSTTRLLNEAEQAEVNRLGLTIEYLTVRIEEIWTGDG